MTRAVVSIDQRCSSVHCPGATLVGWPGLVWTRGIVLTEAVAQLGYLDPAPIHAIKVEGERKPWIFACPSDSESVPAATPPFVRFLRLDSLYSSYSFKLTFFPLCVPGCPGLVWAKGPGLTEMVGQVWHLDLAPICTIKVNGEHKPRCLPAPLIWKEFQQLPCHLWPSRTGFFRC